MDLFITRYVEQRRTFSSVMKKFCAILYIVTRFTFPTTPSLCLRCTSWAALDLSRTSRGTSICTRRPLTPIVTWKTYKTHWLLLPPFVYLERSMMYGVRDHPSRTSGEKAETRGNLACFLGIVFKIQIKWQNNWLGYSSVIVRHNGEGTQPGSLAQAIHDSSFWWSNQ